MGMKVFTDSDSQFLARIFQPTASNLQMEPIQTTASNLKTLVSQSSATLLNATVKQTVAANLQTTANQTSASLLNATVKQGSASLLNATVKQGSASLLQTTLGSRGTFTASQTAAPTATYSNTASINRITLSSFNFFIKGGTTTVNLKIQESPDGTDWIDDDTVIKTLAANALTIYTPTRFSRFVRLAYKRGTGVTTASTITIYSQGQV